MEAALTGRKKRTRDRDGEKEEKGKEEEGKGRREVGDKEKGESVLCFLFRRVVIEMA
jgi:hypothetical protein